MKITSLLMEEHSMIMMGLECMKTARDRIEKGERPPESFFYKAVSFFRRYLDGFHYCEENFLLYGHLARKKKGTMDLEIGALRHERDMCSQFLTHLERFVDGYRQGNDIAVISLLKNLSSFISIFTHHIFRENQFFFPMIEESFSDEEKMNFIEVLRLKRHRAPYGGDRHNVQGVLSEMKGLVVL